MKRSGLSRLLWVCWVLTCVFLGLWFFRTSADSASRFITIFYIVVLGITVFAMFKWFTRRMNINLIGIVMVMLGAKWWLDGYTWLIPNEFVVILGVGIIVVSLVMGGRFFPPDKVLGTDNDNDPEGIRQYVNRK